MNIDDIILENFFKATKHILNAETLMRDEHYQTAATELVKSYTYIYQLKVYNNNHSLTRLSELLYFNSVFKLEQGGD